MYSKRYTLANLAAAGDALVQVKPRKAVVKDVSKKAGKSAGDPGGIFMGERELDSPETTF